MREQARRTKSTRAFLTKRVTQTRLIPRSVSIVYRFRVHSFYFQLLLLLLLSVFSLFVSTIYSSRRRVFCRHHVFLMLLLYSASSSSPVPLVRIRALRAVRTPAVCRKTKKDRKKETRRHVLAKRFVSEKRDASDVAHNKENARKLKKKKNKKKKKNNNNNRRCRQSRWKIQNRARLARLVASPFRRYLYHLESKTRTKLSSTRFPTPSKRRQQQSFFVFFFFVFFFSRSRVATNIQLKCLVF